MHTIHRLDSIAEVRHVIEAVVLPKGKQSAMVAIFQNGRTFGKVPIRSFTGRKGRLRERGDCYWQPRTLREAEIFRGKREDRGKHMLRWSPCSNAPVEKPMSFYERNMFRRCRNPHHLCPNS